MESERLLPWTSGCGSKCLRRPVDHDLRWSTSGGGSRVGVVADFEFRFGYCDLLWVGFDFLFGLFRQWVRSRDFQNRVSISSTSSGFYFGSYDRNTDCLNLEIDFRFGPKKVVKVSGQAEAFKVFVLLLVSDRF
ncbi:hypothetical protein OROGR_027814 [Orobanche gracilis]